MGVEFSDLELVKIEVEHLIPGFDDILPRLEERCLGNWEVPVSSE